jgi:hypothetical protein
MVHVRQAREHGEVVLEFTGGLDLRGADQITEIALQQPGSLRLVIDLTRASNVHDAALGRLIDGLPARERTFLGLNRHQAWVVECLGEPRSPTLRRIKLEGP